MRLQVNDSSFVSFWCKAAKAPALLLAGFHAGLCNKQKTRTSERQRERTEGINFALRFICQPFDGESDVMCGWGETAKSYGRAGGGSNIRGVSSKKGRRQWEDTDRNRLVITS